MQTIVAFIVGFIAAFFGSIPIAGPLAILIVDKALAGERRAAWYVTLGGALVEGLYALGVAVFWPLLLEEWELLVPVSRGVGAGVVGAIGIALVVKPLLIRSGSAPNRTASFLSGITLTGLNPTLIASWAIVTSVVYAEGWLSSEGPSAYLYAAGVAAGDLLWFGLLIHFSEWARRQLEGVGRIRLTRALGFVLVAAGIYLGIKTASGDNASRTEDSKRISSAGFPAEAATALAPQLHLR